MEIEPRKKNLKGSFGNVILVTLFVFFKNTYR